MFILKLVLVSGVILNFTLARPNESTNGIQFDIEALNPSQNEDASIEPLVRRPRQNILAAIFSRGLQSVGARGDWRHCRTTAEGAAIYTNGIDTVCQGFCERTDVTCNDYYRPYFYNYF